MPDILLFAEHRTGQDTLSRGVFQLLIAARQFAGQGGRVAALLIAAEPDAPAAELARAGADRVLTVADARLADYCTLAYAKAVVAAVESVKPAILLGPATAMTRDLFGRVAARLGAAARLGCTG